MRQVYDPGSRTHYLFGGNPGESGQNDERLGDLWQLTLERATLSDVIRSCKYMIRRQQFVEMCSGDTRDALKFVSEIIITYVSETRVTVSCLRPLCP